MQVKLLCSRVGDGFAQNYGDVVEMSDAEARRHIDAGLAEPVGKSPPPKKEPAAAKQPPEKKPPAAGRKKPAAGNK